MTPLRFIDVGCAPEELPPVPPGAIRRAWTAATSAAQSGVRPELGDPRGVRFLRHNGEELRIVFADLDAECWIAGIDRTIGLETMAGLSTCFRLLALIDQMATQTWTRDYFSLGDGDMDIHPTLLQAAAATPLNESAAFRPDDFRRAVSPHPWRAAPRIDQT